MRKSRVPNNERPPRESSGTGQSHRFLGLSLAGGKTDKACLAILEYYPKYRKVFLTNIYDKIKNEENISADLKLCQLADQSREKIVSLALDVPWQVPSCLRCELKCPGIEGCDQPHIRWMWHYHKEKSAKKKPKKLFTPYTQRAAEMHLTTELEEPFLISHALGANRAPLVARAHFLKRRMNLNTIEVFPQLTLWRIGRSLNLMKSHLRFHRHAVRGVESRRAILQGLAAGNVAFVYEQDVKIMIENNHAFEAFLCALTGFLKYRKLTEARPDGFPEYEDWIEFPVSSINWKSI